MSTTSFKAQNPTKRTSVANVANSLTPYSPYAVYLLNFNQPFQFLVHCHILNQQQDRQEGERYKLQPVTFQEMTCISRWRKKWMQHVYSKQAQQWRKRLFVRPKPKGFIRGISNPKQHKANSTRLVLQEKPKLNGNCIAISKLLIQIVKVTFVGYLYFQLF